MGECAPPILERKKKPKMNSTLIPVLIVLCYQHQLRTNQINMWIQNIYIYTHTKCVHLFFDIKQIYVFEKISVMSLHEIILDLTIYQCYCCSM